MSDEDMTKRDAPDAETAEAGVQEAGVQQAAEPKAWIEVLGVYRLTIAEEVYEEQRRILESDELTRAHFAGLVLVEALAHDVGYSLRMGLVGQPPAELGEGNYFQCAYDEALLSEDGEALVERYMNCVEGWGTLRFAFYVHYYDPARPLWTGYGEVACPAVGAAPARLMELVPYRACS